jgi:FkbM family methyltransferase
MTRLVRPREVDLWVHDDEMLSNHIVRENDFFEAPILDYLLAHYPVQKTIIDIGANIGNHTVFFAQFFKHDMILAFEPVYENYEVLLQNAQNYQEVYPINLALGARMGLVEMNKNRSNYGAHSVVEGGEMVVTTIPLDQLYLNRVTLMKIDVESYEPSVLSGAAQTIQRCQPLILIEDWQQDYGQYLPYNYAMIKGWSEHKTYLWAPSGSS